MSETPDFGSGPRGDGVPCSWCGKLACDGYCELALANSAATQEIPELVFVGKAACGCVRSVHAALPVSPSSAQALGEHLAEMFEAGLRVELMRNDDFRNRGFDCPHREKQPELFAAVTAKTDEATR